MSRPRGRPRAEADEKLIESLAAHGMTWREISAVTEVSESTLKRNFATPYRAGLAGLKMSLKRCAVKRALERSDSVLCFLLKTLCKMRDTDTDDDDGAMPWD